MNYDFAKVENANLGAWESMWRLIPGDIAEELGLEIVDFGPVQATLVKSLPRARSLNRIQGAAEPGAVQNGHLAEAIEWMRSEGADFQIHVPVTLDSPGALRATAWLAKQGFKVDDESNLITYVRDTSPLELPEQPGIALYELGENENDSYGLCYVAEDVFDPTTPVWVLISLLSGKERWRCYTAAPNTPDALVAACGAMYVHDGVARLDVDATLASARDQGFNQALLRRRLLDAAERGCHTVTAQLPEYDRITTEPLRHNLLRAGFAEAYRVNCWSQSDGSTRQGGTPAYWLLHS